MRILNKDMQELKDVYMVARQSIMTAQIAWESSKNLMHMLELKRAAEMRPLLAPPNKKQKQDPVTDSIDVLEQNTQTQVPMTDAIDALQQKNQMRISVIVAIAAIDAPEPQEKQMQARRE